MARRSDHTRPELRELILAEAHRLMAEVGYAHFSAREVAKRIGYSIGTIYNVFGSLDLLVVAVNSRTVGLWAATARARLNEAGANRIAALVEGYFDFAERNQNLWMAIYDHHMPEGETFSSDYVEQLGELIGIVETEIVGLLPQLGSGEAGTLTRSLLATVHGHCVFALNGTFALLGVHDPRHVALARVREALAAASGNVPP
ncbi:TetR/AcrR family transcriptional regulator [Roseiarcaceae bacterium H3SJ34-1]|uniref:TetR/AcrR family transcriptional regulator n=1 Tax=Terripilifer ovatus TaxID=3032367 RepID=UPI003AB93518|nr:TetR/AcrR family transcriptional regulator [Roseiarcaceae bacterium H3SJ34-1]